MHPCHRQPPGRTEPFVTHQVDLGDFIVAYDVFGRAAETGALKVVLSRASRGTKREARSRRGGSVRRRYDCDPAMPAELLPRGDLRLLARFGVDADDAALAAERVGVGNQDVPVRFDGNAERADH